MIARGPRKSAQAGRREQYYRFRTNIDRPCLDLLSLEKCESCSFRFSQAAPRTPNLRLATSRQSENKFLTLLRWLKIQIRGAGSGCKTHHAAF